MTDLSVNESGDACGTSWPAPGKLNLMLRIVGRRPDGYHLLQSVFQFIDVCDYIRFNLIDDPVIRLKSPVRGVLERENLCIRAANELKTDSGYPHGVEIDLEKNLPMGGGLGGGSSDAATTLLALNHLWGLNFAHDRLMSLGLKLGADVPVFINGRAAWAEGIGEKLTPLDLEEPWFVVIVPECHVSTAKVFGSPGLTRDNNPVTIKKFLSGWQENDCAAVVTETFPRVEEALSELSRFGKARLTGTGGCVFAVFDSEIEAIRAAASLSRHWRNFVAKGLNRSPLFERFL